MMCKENSWIEAQWNFDKAYKHSFGCDSGLKYFSSEVYFKQ